MSRQYQNVAGFGELREVLKGLKLEVPKVDPSLFKDPSKIQEGVKAIKAGIDQIRKDLTDALSWQEKIRQWLDGIKDEEEQRIAQDTVKEDQGQVQSYIDDCLDLEEIHFRRAAAVVYMKNLFSREIQSCEEAMDIISELEEKDIVSRDEDGPIRLGYTRYSVSDRYGFKDKEAEELSTVVEIFSRKLVRLIYEKREETKLSLEKRATISLEEMVEGQEGICFLKDIPAQSDVKEGKDFWYAGGSMLVELVSSRAGNKYIRPCQLDGETPATGDIVFQVEEMVEKRVSLQHYTLAWEIPPGAGKSFSRIKEAVMRQYGLSDQDAEKYVRKTQMLWHLIKRTLRASKEKKVMDALKEEYKKRADIEAEEFFGGLNGTNEPKQGVVLLAFEGAFKNKKGSKQAPEVYNLFLLARQEKSEDQLLVSVVDAPEHVKEFLGDCFEEKYSVDNNFRGVPEPLGRILRGIGKQVDVACQLKS